MASKAWAEMLTVHMKEEFDKWDSEHKKICEWYVSEIDRLDQEVEELKLELELAVDGAYGTPGSSHESIGQNRSCILGSLENINIKKRRVFNNEE